MGKKKLTRLEEIDQELEELEKQRLSAKESGRVLNKEKADLMMVDQLKNRILTDSPISGAELEWIEAHPKEWKQIKDETKGKRGSRKAQSVTAGGPPVPKKD